MLFRSCVATVDKELGDYVRTLMFSAYAWALRSSVDEIKAVVDPFAGSFISRVCRSPPVRDEGREPVQSGEARRGTMPMWRRRIFAGGSKTAGSRLALSRRISRTRGVSLRRQSRQP